MANGLRLCCLMATGLQDMHDSCSALLKQTSHRQVQAVPPHPPTPGSDPSSLVCDACVRGLSCLSFRMCVPWAAGPTLVALQVLCRWFPVQKEYVRLQDETTWLACIKSAYPLLCCTYLPCLGYTTSSCLDLRRNLILELLPTLVILYHQHSS
ncbi:hypothetical protein F5883DRAFT_539332 [Diaporthe sp. PMI_573]|nr:hypothetical protein F5883DRAFT_539332 [Diaporthaceae sp. PMI_573]